MEILLSISKSTADILINHNFFRYSWYKTRYDRNHTGPDGWYLSSVNTLLNLSNQNITRVGKKYTSSINSENLTNTSMTHEEDIVIEII